MGAIHHIKDVVRPAGTAGPSREVFHLLEKRAGLLTERIAELEQENALLFRQNRNLATENQTLKARLQRAMPTVGELDQRTKDILKFFFESPGRFSPSQICHKFHLSMKVGWRHIDLLCAREFISVHSFAAGAGGEIGYRITSKGRAYCVETGLAP